MIRIPLERSVTPRRVLRARDRSPAPAQLGQPSISDTVLVQRGFERGSFEMPLPSRSRKAPHIGKRFDAVLMQQAKKLAQLAIRVSDCPNLSVHRRRTRVRAARFIADWAVRL